MGEKKKNIFIFGCKLNSGTVNENLICGSSNVFQELGGELVKMFEGITKNNKIKKKINK